MFGYLVRSFLNWGFCGLLVIVLQASPKTFYYCFQTPSNHFLPLLLHGHSRLDYHNGSRSNPLWVMFAIISRCAFTSSYQWVFHVFDIALWINLISAFFSVSAPVIHNISFLDITTGSSKATFGVFGYCSNILVSIVHPFRTIFTDSSSGLRYM